MRVSRVVLSGILIKDLLQIIQCQQSTCTVHASTVHIIIVHSVHYMYNIMFMYCEHTYMYSINELSS